MISSPRLLRPRRSEIDVMSRLISRGGAVVAKSSEIPVPTRTVILFGGGSGRLSRIDVIGPRTASSA